jgi:hypothetical protein
MHLKLHHLVHMRAGHPAPFPVKSKPGRPPKQAAPGATAVPDQHMLNRLPADAPAEGALDLDAAAAPSVLYPLLQKRKRLSADLVVALASGTAVCDATQPRLRGQQAVSGMPAADVARAEAEEAAEVRRWDSSELDGEPAGAAAAGGAAARAGIGRGGAVRKRGRHRVGPLALRLARRAGAAARWWGGASARPSNSALAHGDRVVTISR